MNMINDDTIAAIATPPGEGGIAIIRLSGPQALSIADRVFECAGLPPSKRAGNSFVHGWIFDDTTGEAGPEVIDEVILLVYRAPHSYTRDDVIEIQGHGGAVCARRILRRLIDAGARSADPGEFTRRAFLNGRLDLLQAEAVLDLIRARSDRAATMASDQLNGSLSSLFNDIYDNLVSSAADLESSLDFSEDELPGHVIPEIQDRVRTAAEDLARLRATWDEGQILREGALVVITGQPNVGKSTLLNRLLTSQRAIVSGTPGTTRDTIEEGFILNGLAVRLVDTAGLRETDCEVEREGIARAGSYINRADVQIYVMDASIGIGTEDRTNLERLDGDHSIIVLNKIDLGQAVEADEVRAYGTPIECCLINGVAPDGIKDALSTIIESGIPQMQQAAISERHRSLIVNTITSVDEGLSRLGENEESGVLLAANALRDAIEHLGLVTGRVYHDELLESVFSRFCIGK